MSLAECVAATAKELGLPEGDVKQIAEQLQKHRDRLKRTLPFDEKLQAALRKKATEEGEKARIAAALRKRHVQLNIVKREEWKADLATMAADGVRPDEAILAKLVGNYKGQRLSRKSISARRAALEASWIGPLNAELNRELPHLVPFLRRWANIQQLPGGSAMTANLRAEQKAMMDDIVREMWEVKAGGNRGVTKNKDAAKAAEIFAKYAEASRLELNRAGANIGKLDGWAPQAHDSLAVARANEGEWVDFVTPLLDVERSFPDVAPDDLPKVLSSVYENIVTGRDLTPSAKQQGQRVGPANLASSLGEHRVLHFKNADAQLAYNERFGRGHVFSGLVDHLHMAARKASVMQVLGPNPQVFLDAALEDMRDGIRRGTVKPWKKGKALREWAVNRGIARELNDNDAKTFTLGLLEADLASPTTTRIGKAFAEVTGVTHSLNPAHVSVAKIAAQVRAMESMAKLGGATISSATDVATFAHGLRQQGMPLLQSQRWALQALMEGKGDAEKREIMTLVGAGMDSMLGDIHMRYAADDGLPGTMSAAQNAFFKLNLLTWWTERLEGAYARMTTAWLGLNAGKGYAALPDGLRNTLGQHGIDEARWEVLRKAAHQAEDGTTYVLPDRVAELDDALFAGLDKDAARAKRDLQLLLHGYIADETSFGVVRGDDRTRMATLHGTQRGTVMGEAARFFFQFKTFPWAYSRKIIGRTYNRGDYAGLGWLIAASTIIGYGSMSAKDVLKNKTPRDPASPDTWIAAFLQGGGLGIYGDFLFSKYDRFGGGFLSKVAGPTAGAVSDTTALWYDIWDGAQKRARGEDVNERKTAADAFALALNNTPFLNLWWLRAGLDMAVLNNMQEMLSPGTFRRREQKMKKEYGQEYILEPVR